MSNRILSLLVLVVVLIGLFSTYYYLFASNARISIILTGSGDTSISLASEFGNTSEQVCEKTCVFENIAAVNYTITAKREGYIPLVKTIKLNRREDRKVAMIMEKEIELTEKTKKKEETITLIKLKKDIQDTLETTTGAITLGYQAAGLHYALPGENGTWDIFQKKEWVEATELFKIPEGILGAESLDIYPGYIALKKREKLSFYSLVNGQETIFDIDGPIISIKDTNDDDTKIILTDAGVFMYTVSEKISRKNPLYDDIIQFSSGELIALVKKWSQEKRALLSIADDSNDYVFLIGQDTRERKILLKTSQNWRLLRYKNKEILFVDEQGGVFVIENVK